VFRQWHVAKAEFAALIAAEEHKGVAAAEVELKAQAALNLGSLTQALKKV